MKRKADQKIIPSTDVKRVKRYLDYDSVDIGYEVLVRPNAGGLDDATSALKGIIVNKQPNIIEISFPYDENTWPPTPDWNQYKDNPGFFTITWKEDEFEKLFDNITLDNEATPENCEKNLALFGNVYSISQKDRFTEGSLFGNLNLIIEIIISGQNNTILKKDNINDLINQLNIIIYSCKDLDMYNRYSQIALNMREILSKINYFNIDQNLDLSLGFGLSALRTYTNLQPDLQDLENCIIKYIIDPINWINEKLTPIQVLYKKKSDALTKIKDNISKSYYIDNLQRITFDRLIELNEENFKKATDQIDYESLIAGDFNSAVKYIIDVTHKFCDLESVKEYNIYKKDISKYIEHFKEETTSSTNNEAVKKFLCDSMNQKIELDTLDLVTYKDSTTTTDWEKRFITFLEFLERKEEINYSTISQSTGTEVGKRFEYKIIQYLKDSFGFTNYDAKEKQKRHPRPGDFIHEPNGENTYPDFHIYLNHYVLPLEAKATSSTNILLSNTIPDANTLYLVLSSRARGYITYMFGYNLLNDESRLELLKRKFQTNILNKNKEITNNGIVTQNISSQFSTIGNFFTDNIYLDIKVHVKEQIERLAQPPSADPNQIDFLTTIRKITENPRNHPIIYTTQISLRDRIFSVYNLYIPVYFNNDNRLFYWGLEEFQNLDTNEKNYFADLVRFVNSINIYDNLVLQFLSNDASVGVKQDDSIEYFHYIPNRDQKNQFDLSKLKHRDYIILSQKIIPSNFKITFPSSYNATHLIKKLQNFSQYILQNYKAWFTSPIETANMDTD
tara:strand:- start:360 stop:2726 length:2367 start_codon:yes stop_codon:yes gene_type:complete